MPKPQNIYRRIGLPNDFVDDTISSANNLPNSRIAQFRNHPPPLRLLSQRQGCIHQQMAETSGVASAIARTEGDNLTQDHLATAE